VEAEEKFFIDLERLHYEIENVSSLELVYTYMVRHG